MMTGNYFEARRVLEPWNDMNGTRVRMNTNLPTRSVKTRTVCGVVLAAVLLFLLWAAVRGSFVPMRGGTYAPGPSLGLSNKLKPYRIIPEYDRTMKKVVISLAKRDVSLRYHHETLLKLPEYTQIILLVPESNVELMKNELGNKPYRDRVQLVLYDPRPRNGSQFYLLFPEKAKLIQVDADEDHLSYTQGSLWARDLFVVAEKPDGKALLLISDVHKWFNTHDESSLNVISDNSYLDSLRSAGMDVLRTSVTFDGGNILVDELGGKRIVICGGDILRCTQTVWKSTRESTPTDSQVIGMLKKFLNADEVVVVGSTEVQPSLMFHLDQAMIFLPNRTVGITQLVGEPADEASSADVEQVNLFLSELRSVLLGLGYRLVTIDTSVSNLLNHQHYVNAIPFIHGTTGARMLLMPVFLSAQTQFDKKIVKKNTSVFESLGYKVVHIPTEADNIHGGLHCLVNVVE